MNHDTSLKEIIDDFEIKSLLSDLIHLIETPVSIEDVNGHLLLGEFIINSTAEYLIIADQQPIGSMKGDSSTQIIARLLSYLANQENLVFFDDLTTIPNRRYFNRYYQHNLFKG
ncbi:hypothetical protein [Crocosphaera subtropica]|nr:hypothetical protein [Crocosphaera subtropica]